VQLGKLRAELVVVVVAQAQLAGDGGDGEQRQFGGGRFDSVDSPDIFSRSGEGCCAEDHIGLRVSRSQQQAAILICFPEREWPCEAKRSGVLVCGVLVLGSTGWAQAANACGNLTSLRIPGVEIVKAEMAPVGTPRRCPRGGLATRGRCRRIAAWMG